MVFEHLQLAFDGTQSQLFLLRLSLKCIYKNKHGCVLRGFVNPHPNFPLLYLLKVLTLKLWTLTNIDFLLKLEFCFSQKWIVGLWH